MGVQLVQIGATILCMHGGTASATPGSPRVKLSGQPAMTLTDVMSIAGCTWQVSGSPVPCLTGQWLQGATRITMNGVPAILMNSTATCIPNGTPVNILMTQMRVAGI